MVQFLVQCAAPAFKVEQGLAQQVYLRWRTSRRRAEVRLAAGSQYNSPNILRWASPLRTVTHINKDALKALRLALDEKLLNAAMTRAIAS
ncbi:hypothetical protein [Luteimonas changyuni]|uniref:hypothetical protein n=1 Tax=Luteimonas sp. MJ145 TaxID=3129234 RepID=UPI0031BB118E